MTMAEHTAFAGLLAEHFGNAAFQSLEPREEMLYLVAHHDAGWADIDALALRDPETGLPYHLVQTPFELILRTSAASPDFNERRHAYCGLLSSMHSWGLYNGRYGLSDKHLIEALPQDKRSAAEAMLSREERRQSDLIGKLRGGGETESWVEPPELMRNYKLLQFFDTLALYFHCTDEALRTEASFDHVPRALGNDATVTLSPLGDGVYRLQPYPFDEPQLRLTFSGRELAASPSGESLAQEMRAAPVSHQAVELCS
jgi:hypothetical protein